MAYSHSIPDTYADSSADVYPVANTNTSADVYSLPNIHTIPNTDT
jgi:hypothetical protein